MLLLLSIRNLRLTIIQPGCIFNFISISIEFPLFLPIAFFYAIISLSIKQQKKLRLAQRGPTDSKNYSYGVEGGEGTDCSVVRIEISFNI